MSNTNEQVDEEVQTVVLSLRASAMRLNQIEDQISQLTREARRIVKDINGTVDFAEKIHDQRGKALVDAS